MAPSGRPDDDEMDRYTADCIDARRNGDAF
jgi:hypothetical protein